MNRKGGNDQESIQLQKKKKKKKKKKMAKQLSKIKNSPRHTMKEIVNHSSEVFLVMEQKEI